LTGLTRNTTPVSLQYPPQPNGKQASLGKSLQYADPEHPEFPPQQFQTPQSAQDTTGISNPSLTSPYLSGSSIVNPAVNNLQGFLYPEEGTLIQRLFEQLEQNNEGANGESKERASGSNSPNGDSYLMENKTTLHKLVPSDSGYHSGLGTDTESVCSMGSVGTSLGLPQDLLQDFIAFFGDTLIDRAGARAWAEYALAQHAPEVIEQRLDGLLKDYTIELLSMTEFSQEVETQHKQPHQAGGTDGRIASGAAKLIRRYRPKIARYFRDHAVSAPLTSKSMAVRLQELSKQLSLAEKLGLFEKTSSGRKDPNNVIGDVKLENGIEDDCENGDESEYLADLAPIRDFLVSGKAFQNLATAMRRSFYCDDRTGMDQITSQVLKGLAWADPTFCQNCSGSQDDGKRCGNHRSIYSVRFNVTWGLQDFLQSQFGNRVPRVGSLVALTGSALYAQATTCSDYLQTTWPRSGSFFLSTLQTTIDYGNKMGEKEHRRNRGKAFCPLYTPSRHKCATIDSHSFGC
jgi:hypothetical protein